MDDQSGGSNRIELAGSEQVESAKALPNRLLHAADDAKRREVAGGSRIGEIADDAQFEETLTVAIRIGLAQA